MEIHLRIDSVQPPVGSASGGDSSQDFVGWLGMLRVVAELLGSDLAGPDMLDAVAARPDPDRR
jgi:hypothetical protein